MFPDLPGISSQIKSSEPHSVKLWEAMPGRHRGETVQVSPVQMSELKTAQNVIDLVKETLTGGTGNQKTDYILTRGESYQRAVAARHVRDKDFQGDNQAIVKSALAALGGTCGEQSALAMAYLSMMDLKRPIYTYAAANHPDHQFNVIGDLREPRQAVIVDSWPVFARAHLADNAQFQPDSQRILDVHMPSSVPKMAEEAFGEVVPLSNERILHINQQHQTPAYNEVLESPERIRLQGRMHAIRNLGVRYQNRDNEAEILDNIVDRAFYERHALAMQQARPLFPDGEDH